MKKQVLAAQTKTPDIDHETEERDDQVIGTALNWSLVVVIVIVGLSLDGVYLYHRLQTAAVYQETEVAPAQLRAYTNADVPQVPFVDITAEAGIKFEHDNGVSQEMLFPEAFGGGCAFFDCDNDGDQDILFTNSRTWKWFRPEYPLATAQLYLNDGTGHFQNATVGSGLGITSFGMGVAIGDYDNDGLDDVYLTSVGPNSLFHNIGGGKFLDVTKSAGVEGADESWSTSAGWFDYDRDGDLDLFVCSYVNWSREKDLAHSFRNYERSYGRPELFEGSFSYLFRNDGNGTFADVSDSAGIQIRNSATGVPLGKSLGVTFDDFDRDGWIDVVVANDKVQNQLFHNLGDGTFEEIAKKVGVAFDIDGKARAGMGIDTSRFRNNDAVGIAIGNFTNEQTALYVAYENKLQFTDEAAATGLGPDTFVELKFGLFFFDYDLDSRLDVLITSGHILPDIFRQTNAEHYEQPVRLLWNCGPESSSEFRPVFADHAGPDLFVPMVGRGTSYADIDGDGDLDVLLAPVVGPARLVRNDQQLGHHWLRFWLTGTHCNRDAIGAWIDVPVGDQVLSRQVMPTRSYLSQVERPVTFGLGPEDHVGEVTIRWPDGTQQQVHVDQVDRLYQVQQDTLQ